MLSSSNGFQTTLAILGITKSEYIAVNAGTNVGETPAIFEAV
jgi:hypothetical protein